MLYGIRISYYKNNFNKGLKELMIENFSAFREWYHQYDKDSMEEFGEPFGGEEVKAYFAQNPDFERDFDDLDKLLINELTSEFIGNYIDLTDHESRILEFFGPTMSKWRYDASTEMVIATKDEEFIRLWNYLIKGRSLKDGQAGFADYTNKDKIGFLYFSEQELLKGKIESYFGDAETIRQKYWTDQEREALKEAIANPNDDSYGLFNHDPRSSGLEYVLDALRELDHRNVEIITMIDNS